MRPPHLGAALLLALLGCDAAVPADAAPVNPASVEALTLLFQVSGALVELGPDGAVA